MNRFELEEKILEVIFDRCDRNANGKLLPGCLQAYTYYKLGRKEYPPTNFCILLNDTLMRDGIWKCEYDGINVFRGLSWKNEHWKDWRKPKALDIPLWISKKLRFKVIKEDGTIDTNYLMKL